MLSKPVYLSSVALTTGYQCPAGKTAIIKQIVLCNETSGVGYVDIKWEDKNSVGVGTTSPYLAFPVAISGLAYPFAITSVLNEFLTIKALDNITVQAQIANRVNVLFTIIEQDV